jgi:hypothetical protein
MFDFVNGQLLGHGRDFIRKPNVNGEIKMLVQSGAVASPMDYCCDPREFPSLIVCCSAPLYSGALCGKKL